MANPFNTPANERSFSGLIDSVVAETGRVQNLATIIQYANLTIRECQALGLFLRDREETSVAVSATPFLWTRPDRFRSIGAVDYGYGVYPKYINPGRQQFNECLYYYGVDDYFVFMGISVGMSIKLMLYYWASRLLYCGRLGVETTNFQGGPYPLRKAYYDLLLLKWQYLNNTNNGYVDTTGVDAIDELYRKVSSHWLLEDWWDLVVTGTKAKVYAQTGDTDKAQRSFAMYTYNQKLLQNTTGFGAEFGAM